MLTLSHCQQHKLATLQIQVGQWLRLEVLAQSYFLHPEFLLAAQHFIQKGLHIGSNHGRGDAQATREVR